MGAQRDRDQRDVLRVVPPPGRAEPIASRANAWQYLRPVAPTSDKKLTARELEVLRCFAEGLGTEAIAARLTISRTTVRNHTQRILAKLEVHTRLAAVARGYATGVIDIPGTS